MTSIVPIVEGYGDVAAVPALIGRAAAHFQKPHYSLAPIRAGEYRSLKRAGQIERFLELAASRHPDRILVALDLDDDCPATEFNHLIDRITAWRGDRIVPVGVCFFKCEYEALFLCQLDQLFGVEQPMISPEEVRAAKGYVEREMGSRYKETRDQIILTKQLDIDLLVDRSRSFRKFIKEVDVV